MKRFHVHLHVDDIAKSVAFHLTLFGAEPTRLEGDYAKWMLEDPRVNFAISNRGDKTGVDHLGLQTDDVDELAELRSRAEAADLTMLDKGETTCCYARGDKHWLTDPQGVAWEHFHTLGDVLVFGVPRAAEAAAASPAATACCAATPSSKMVAAGASRACC